MILCDTGALFSMVDRTQPKHQSYRQTVIELNEPLLTTWACIAEVMYLALGKGGWPMQKQVARYVFDGLLMIYDIDKDSYDRLFQLMEKYQDRPMDLADATLVLAAEKTREHRILTLDNDFLFYRIDNQKNFQIIEV